MAKILGKMEEMRDDTQGDEIEEEDDDDIDFITKTKRKASEREKENQPPIEDLEFPPGLPRPIHLCPPPGIRPRPQRALHSTYQSNKNMTNLRKLKAEVKSQLSSPTTERVHHFNQPNVEILQNVNRKRRKPQERVPEDFFDPMNPENPFFGQHPNQQNHLHKQVMKLERQQKPSSP
eukprot:UN25492